MRHQLAWRLTAFLALAALTVLGVRWFFEHFEQAPVKRQEMPRNEARHNPFLASERLFARLGRPVRMIRSAARLDTLPPGGVLILDGKQRHTIDEKRAERLLDWVADGGYLIAATVWGEDDALLARLGVNTKTTALTQCSVRPMREASDPASPADADTDAANVVIPGDPVVYRLREPVGPGLRSSLPEPAWLARAAGLHSAVLHYAWGRGQITVFESLDFLRNKKLGQHDHAELVWALLKKYGPHGEIRLATQWETPSLVEWLVESAWMLLFSTAALILLWLWQIIPRFGGTLARRADERRELGEHLAAIGRSLWREGGTAHLLALLRRTVAGRPAHRPASQIAPLADEGKLSPDSFTRAMQAVQRWESTK